MTATQRLIEALEADEVGLTRIRWEMGNPKWAHVTLELEGVPLDLVMELLDQLVGDQDG